MATAESTMAHILDRLAGAGDVRTLRMFGEYGLYCDQKLIGVICDDVLYLKPLDLAEAQGLDLRVPHPGAKPHIVVPEEMLDDPDRLIPLVRATFDALPVPKKVPKRLQT